MPPRGAGRAAGAATAADAGPVRGDTLVAGSIGDASNLLPALASDSSSFDIIGLVYNGLVRYDKDLKIEGELASSWEISPDGLQILVPPAPRREVARRRRFHRRRRRVHLARR